MAKDRPTIADTFVNAVRDELEGTPNKSHPVQFKTVRDIFVACTLCGSAIPDTEAWRKLHRDSHDTHNKVHQEIETEARRYKSPPRYG